MADLEPESDYAMLRCRHAWADLNTCRTITSDWGHPVVNMIPWWAIWFWCIAEQLDRESTRIMIYVIRTLDADAAEARAAKARQDALTNGTGERKRR